MIAEPEFADGIAHYSFSGGYGTTFAVRSPGQDWAHPSFPTLQIHLPNTTAGGYVDVATTPFIVNNDIRAPGVTVKPGSHYTASVYVSTHRCEFQLYIQWVDVTGAAINGAPESVRGDFGPGQPRNPDTWTRFATSGTAPANAVMARLLFRKYGTTSGVDSWVFLWKPMLEEVGYAHQAPGTWAPGGTAGMWDGKRLFSDTILARHVSAETMQAINGRFGSLAAANIKVGFGEIDNAKIGQIIQSGNYVGGPNGQGWSINKDGNAEFNRIIIRRQLAVDTGTIDVPAIDEIDGHGIAAGPAQRRTAITSIPMSAWAGTQKTYLAVAGITVATVTTAAGAATGAELWGWTATVIPLTRWSDPQQLRILFEFYCQGIRRISAHTITWRLYEVS